MANPRKHRRLEVSLQKLRDLYGEGADPILFLGAVMNDRVNHIDELTTLPVRVPVELPLRITAAKAILDKTVPTLKAVEVDTNAEMVEGQRVLSHVPLPDILAALAAGLTADDVVKH